MVYIVLYDILKRLVLSDFWNRQLRQDNEYLVVDCYKNEVYNCYKHNYQNTASLFFLLKDIYH